ncbi:MAG: hypothetical protein O6945_04975 [Gammaproteobacteria bacterium]|nr:hypothetical protein [Gammaproteobacteria bacterium]
MTYVESLTGAERMRIYRANKKGTGHKELHVFLEQPAAETLDAIMAAYPAASLPDILGEAIKLYYGEIK